MRVSDIDVVSSDLYENGAPYEQFARCRPAGPARRLQASFIHGSKELPVEATPLG